MLLFMFVSTGCYSEAAAQDPTPPDPPVPVQEVRQIAQQVDAAQARMYALEHFLTDQLAVKEGRAPKGWKQPDLEEYCKPGAPDSFLPPPPSVATTRAASSAPAVQATRTVGPYGPTLEP